MPSRSPRRAEADRTVELVQKLEAVYREADELFAGWSCPASTECCRFGVTGREPYLTSIELAAMRRAIAARGGPRAWKRAAPLGGSSEPARRGALPVARDERRCPMLTDAGGCSIYAARPLGCRTFDCDRAAAAGKLDRRAIGELVRRVQAIAAAHEPDGDRGRPLTRALDV